VTLIKKTIQALIQRQLVNYYSFFIIFIIIALGLVMQSLDIVFRYFFIWAGQKNVDLLIVDKSEESISVSTTIAEALTCRTSLIFYPCMVG
jgi:hypothetical protein